MMPVNVCFMIDNLSRAGTESQLLALIHHLDRSKVQPSLVLLDGRGELSRSLEPSDCPILRLGMNSILRPAVISGAWKLRRFWKENRVDILQSYFLDSVYLSVPLARLCGIKRVLRVRNNLGEWLTPKHRVLGRVVGSLAHFTLTNSEEGRQKLREVEGLDAKRVIVLENGVDLQRFDKVDVPNFRKTNLRVGLVGNLRKVKNVEGLIRAAHCLTPRFPTLMFEVAGEGPDREELQGLIDHLGLSTRFHLRGSVSDIPTFLQSLDVAVLCSHSEGMSNALLEYMAAMRPIVATDVGANNRLITHETEGLLIPTGNVEALSEAIASLLSNQPRSITLAKAARKKVEAEFSRDAMRQRFEEFYSSITA
jgi:glycosyltransferase involved in cell wall biosynthesis